MRYKVYFDVETRSYANLKDVGAYLYASHPSTELLCASFRVEKSGKTVLIPFEEFYLYGLLDSPRLDDFRKLCQDENALIIAHNAFFEECIYNQIFVKRFDFPELGVDKWRCTLAKAAMYSLPLGLEECLTKGLGLGERKHEEGKRVMMRLSRPRRKTAPDGSRIDCYFQPTPYELGELYEYNKIDVELEETIDTILPTMPKFEREVWLFDQELNMKGVKADKANAVKLLEIIEMFRNQLLSRFEGLTNYEVESPNQREKLLKHLKKRGLNLPDLQKETVTNVLESHKLPEDLIAILNTRLAMGKSSVSKLDTLIQTSCDKDQRMRGLLQYHAASTGRWGGRQLQPQNLPNPAPGFNQEQFFTQLEYHRKRDFIEDHPSLMHEASSAIRGFIVPEQGKIFRVGDFNAIEARVSAWFCKEEALLKLFHDDEDPYVWMAGKIIKCSPQSVTKEQRKWGKSAILGCGYQMGPDKFSVTYGIPLELAQSCVDTFRNTFQNFPIMWRKVEAAAKLAIESGQETSISYVKFKTVLIGGIKFLICKLPSGRALFYPYVRLEERTTSWGAIKETIVYGGVTQTRSGRRWSMDIPTYGGKLLENIIQAIARDLLVNSLFELKKEGFNPVLSVHDEGITEDDIGFKSIEEFEKVMERKLEWAKDIPIKVEAWEGYRYKK